MFSDVQGHSQMLSICSQKDVLKMFSGCSQDVLSMYSRCSHCSIRPSQMGEQGVSSENMEIMEHGEHRKDGKHQSDDLKHSIYDSKRPVYDIKHSIWDSKHSILQLKCRRSIKS